MNITKEHDCVKVQIGYNPFYNEKLKILGGKWSRDDESWRIPLYNYNLVVELFERTKEVPESSAESRIKSVRDDMIRLGYSIKTVKTYTSIISLYLKYTGSICTTESINAYMLYLLEERHCSHSYCNQAVNAIKFYARKYSTISESEIIRLQRPKKEKKLPKVMSKEEVKAVLDVTENVKHKTELMIAYSCGLRVSEVANLRVQDVDSKRMVVMIKQGKGRKDRQAMLSEKMLGQLREYYKVYRPKEWLFENQRRNGPISDRTLQKVFNNSVVRAGIRKPVSFHSLRHYVESYIM